MILYPIQILSLKLELVVSENMLLVKSALLTMKPNDSFILLSQVKLCCSYLKFKGQPYLYEDGVEFAKASLLYIQYMQNDEGSSSTIPSKPINDLSTSDKLGQVSYAATEENSQFLKSIRFEGRETNCTEFVRAGRQIIGMYGYGIDSDNELDPPFVYDRDMTSKLEFHEAPHLEDVEWADDQVHGVRSILTPLILAIFTPQFPLTWDNNVGEWHIDGPMLMVEYALKVEERM